MEEFYHIRDQKVKTILGGINMVALCKNRV